MDLKKVGSIDTTPPPSRRSPSANVNTPIPLSSGVPSLAPPQPQVDMPAPMVLLIRRPPFVPP